MRVFPSRAASHFLALIVTILAVSLLQLSAAAQEQNQALQAACNASFEGTLAAVKITPARGWQMQGREIRISPISIAQNEQPIVCFRWKLAKGNRAFTPAETVYVSKDSSSEVSVVVPDLGLPPPQVGVSPQDAGVYTPDNAAAIADVKVVVLGPDKKPVRAAITSVAVVGPRDFCNVPNLGTRSDTGSVVSTAYKNWQPVNGEIEFTAKAYKTIPDSALIRVCFRWKLIAGAQTKLSDSGPIRVLDRDPSHNTIKLAVTIPDIPNQPGRFGNERIGSYAIPRIAVPETDVRVLIFDNELNPVVDAWTKCGITSIFFAFIVTAITIGLAFLLLLSISRWRLPTLRKVNPLLCVITTRQGFASLSQFQIMLWTFVVIASAAYVMALSGDLIPITTGTLVLLGISGSATVVAKAKTESDASAAPVPLDSAAAAAQAALLQQDATVARQAVTTTTAAQRAEAEALAAEAEAKAAAAKTKANSIAANEAAAKARQAVATATDKAAAEQQAIAEETDAEMKRKIAAIAEAKASAAMRIRHPRWSDLVMEEIQGRELDVTRIQMLYFTIVTAVFVILKVLTSYEIPVIPEGYLILMGISNSVYIGSKFATNPAART